jgi:hypothetical protein
MDKQEKTKMPREVLEKINDVNFKKRLNEEKALIYKYRYTRYLDYINSYLDNNVKK